jgi:uncharacterized repeat protein (TIGR01451 family)
VRDLDGGDALPGDVLEYTVTVANEGQDGATNVVLGDAIPDGTAYVPDSAAIVGGPGTASFDGDGVRFALGPLAPGEGRVVRFRVTVDAGVPARTAIVNRARADFTSQTLRLPIDTASAPVSTPVRVPDPAPAPDDPAPAPNDPPAVPASPATPAVAQAAAAAAGRGCVSDAVRLVDVAGGPDGVRLAGQTAPTNAGRAVSLSFAGRHLGSATVSADGKFRARVALPPWPLRFNNAARYQAVLGPMRSPALKLARRMHVTRLATRGATVTIAGRVSGPLAAPARTVTLRQYEDCTGTAFRVVARDIRVSASGHFTATVPAPTGVDVAYYRALTRVRKTPRSPKTYPTFTLVRAVAVAPRATSPSNPS